RVARMYDYAGDFKVQLVLPPAAKGLSADGVTIPAGQNEAKVVLKAAADAAPGARPDLILRAVAMVNGNVPATHELKFAVNIIKQPARSAAEQFLGDSRMRILLTLSLLPALPALALAQDNKGEPKEVAPIKVVTLDRKGPVQYEKDI